MSMSMSDLERQQRAMVVAEALSWVGTGYHPEGRVKCIRDESGKIIDKGGVDCGTLIYEVFVRTELVPPFPIAHYPPDWHLHQTEERYFKYVIPHSERVDEPLPGDVVLYKFGKSRAHGGIIIDPGWPRIVHAELDSRLVLEAVGDQGRMSGLQRTYMSYWAKAR